MKPNSVKSKIKDKLISVFNPSFLDLINESHLHNVPENSETHFKLIIVSDLFKDLSLVKRHKKVFESLGVTNAFSLVSTLELVSNGGNISLKTTPSDLYPALFRLAILFANTSILTCCLIPPDAAIINPSCIANSCLI